MADLYSKKIKFKLSAQFVRASTGALKSYSERVKKRKIPL